MVRSKAMERLEVKKDIRKNHPSFLLMKEPFSWHS